jgi:hypothetical protein
MQSQTHGTPALDRLLLASSCSPIRTARVTSPIAPCERCRPGRRSWIKRKSSGLLPIPAVVCSRSRSTNRCGNRVCDRFAGTFGRWPRACRRRPRRSGSRHCKPSLRFSRRSCTAAQWVKRPIAGSRFSCDDHGKRLGWPRLDREAAVETLSDGSGVVRLLEEEPTKAERYAHAAALLAILQRAEARHEPHPQLHRAAVTGA